ncbi:hypothetical protein PENANT_c040G03779 [Penicillium antarcticum]|uniref:Uncharacterized protein n=1 Tax=Penicillium antarcticum TaxID=416450 RepID=A0A1V6PTF3_9EURO|nr:hypothetical protein PENANT_c040G03779 [Penicillium antarcticum]
MATTNSLRLLVDGSYGALEAKQTRNGHLVPVSCSCEKRGGTIPVFDVYHSPRPASTKVLHFNVSSMLPQKLDDFEMAIDGCYMDWSLATFCHFMNIGICTMLKQKLHNRKMPAAGCYANWGLAITSGFMNIGICTILKQKLYNFEIAAV